MAELPTFDRKGLQWQRVIHWGKCYVGLKWVSRLRIVFRGRFDYNSVEPLGSCGRRFYDKLHSSEAIRAPVSLAQQRPVGQSLLIIKAWRSHLVWHTTLGRTSLDEGSVRRRDLYLKTHNTHKKKTSMPLAGSEPAVPTCERPPTHALNRAAIGID
jgi:hypothetical protein